MSLAYNKFNVFVADVANKVHNLGSDTITVLLTDTLPVSTNVYADIVQISYTNLSSRTVPFTSSGQSSGLYKLIQGALVLTASGAVAQWRYIVLCNSTASKLISWYDSGAEQNMVSSDTFTITPDATNGTLQLT